jgi:hypothetical protein
MTTIHTAAAAFVLPVGATLAAGSAALAAFLGRREPIAVKAGFSADRMPATGWSSPSVTRTFVATSYVPQSRGSTG